MNLRRAMVFAADVEKSRSPNVVGSTIPAAATVAVSPSSTKVAAISVENTKGFAVRPASPIPPQELRPRVAMVGIVP